MRCGVSLLMSILSAWCHQIWAAHEHLGCLQSLQGRPRACSAIVLMAVELVCAGVANIMAYSWFSHCEKYLKALEYEKRFMKQQKVTSMATCSSNKVSLESLFS